MAQTHQVIFFDAAETLFHIKGSVAEIYQHHAVRHGFKQTPDSLTAIKQAFSRAFKDAPPAIFASTEPAALKQSERLWWFDVVHNVFYRVGMFAGFDEFFEEVFEVFADPKTWALYPETEHVLSQLKAQGMELGIISNFDSRLFPVLRGLGIEQYFDTVTISSLSQAAKPAPKIFHLALEKHAVDPEDAVHVGDSLRDDVEGAIKAGLTGILLDRSEAESVPGIHRVRSLDQLLPLLMNL